MKPRKAARLSVTSSDGDLLKKGVILFKEGLEREEGTRIGNNPTF